jgi:hypothetical protein
MIRKWIKRLLVLVQSRGEGISLEVLQTGCPDSCIEVRSKQVGLPLKNLDGIDLISREGLYHAENQTRLMKLKLLSTPVLPEIPSCKPLGKDRRLDYNEQPIVMLLLSSLIPRCQ